jgi:hypothetical protein
MTPVAELKRAHRATWAAEGRWQECRHELLALAERRNEAADGSLLMRAEYLVAVGRRPNSPGKSNPVRR